MIEIQPTVKQQPKVDKKGKKYFTDKQFELRKESNLVPIGWDQNGNLILGKTTYSNNSHGT
ncbi:MAG: hypothetical protein ACD_19C00355G0018 [uncultured bacterium]|nr:MAG: hypothetical protein ACD_19C00355G0018 [uncultured bacterium]